MGFSKAKLYNKDIKVTSDFARALGHPARMEILMKLCKDGPSKVEDISKDHPISKSSMSDHLEKLRNQHFISFKEKFPHIIYSVEQETVRKAEQCINAFFRKLNISDTEEGQ